MSIMIADPAVARGRLRGYTARAFVSSRCTGSADLDRDLRSLLLRLRRDGELAVVRAPVDAKLEIAEIHRRVIAAGGPALHFTNVLGSPLSVATNLFGTRRRVELAFGENAHGFVQRAARWPHELLPPSAKALWAQRRVLPQLWRMGSRRVAKAPVQQLRLSPPRLTELPALQCWPQDGGAFLTLPLVYTEHPDGLGAPNLGLYRMQRYDATSLGMHWQIGKGGGFHYAAAEAKGASLPVHVFLGGPPALVLAAIAPLPENAPELLLASLILGDKLDIALDAQDGLPIVAQAEIALLGEVRPRERRPEGPFGDHYGYYSLQHDFPVFHCHTLLRRRDAILPATVVGKPRQEDFYLGDFLQELLSPIFPVVMPQVESLWSYGETGYHSLAAAVVRQRYKREAMSAAFRILGEGQLALTKFLLVLDQRRDLRDFRGTLEHVLARCDFRTDLHVFGQLAMDTLDYNGPALNEGSKGVLLGVGEPIRELPRHFAAELPRGVRDARVFCGGCLVLSGPSAAQEADAGSRIAAWPAFADWPLLVLVDDAERATRSEMNFLWLTFTRFEPASHVHAAGVRPLGFHASLRAPVLIDARLRPDFPEELFCDEPTARRVESRWHEYFPDGKVEMGDSDRAHLD
jgi:UbiD family decarboxylase